MQIWRENISHCHAHLGNHVTYYHYIYIYISKKGLKTYSQNTISDRSLKNLMITKILGQNHAAQNKIWPELSDGVH